MKSAKHILTSIASKWGWCWALGHTIIQAEKLSKDGMQMLTIDGCIYCKFRKTVATRPLRLGEVVRMREERELP